MSVTLPFLGSPTVTVPASSQIAAYSEGQYSVVQTLANGAETVLFAGEGAYTSSAFAAAANLVVSGGANFPLYYSIGVAAFVPERRIQSTPGTLNATGALTAALIYTGIVTSSTAAAVAGTLPTGTVMDASSSFAVDDFVQWSLVNTGPNTFTVTAATDHTIVGAGAVATATSGRFVTRKTAANTFVTYRV